MSAAVSLTLLSQKLIAKAATFNQNALFFSLSAPHNPTSKSPNTTSSRNRTAFAITSIADQFLVPALISLSLTLAMPTWIRTPTCHIRTTVPMQTTRRSSAITISLFRIMKFSLWDEKNQKMFCNSTTEFILPFKKKLPCNKT